MDNQKFRPLLFQSWCAITSIILVLAAVLKAYQLFDGFYESQSGILLVSVLIAGEICLVAIWAVHRQSLLYAGITAVLFTAFSVYALVRLFSGQVECSCFGYVRVSPMSSLLLTVPIAVTGYAIFVDQLLMVRRSIAKSRNVIPTMLAVGFQVILIMLTTFGIVEYLNHTGINSSRNLVGRQLNDLLADGVPQETKTRLKAGNWNIFAYREGCEKCNSAMGKWMMFSSSDYSANSAWMSVGSTDIVDRSDGLIRVHCREGLSIKVPLVISSTNGEIVNVASDDILD